MSIRKRPRAFSDFLDYNLALGGIPVDFFWLGTWKSWFPWQLKRSKSLLRSANFTNMLQLNQNRKHTCLVQCTQRTAVWSIAAQRQMRWLLFIYSWWPSFWLFWMQAHSPHCAVFFATHFTQLCTSHILHTFSIQFLVPPSASLCSGTSGEYKKIK